MRSILLIDDDEDDCFFLSHALGILSDEFTLCCMNNVDHLLKHIDINAPALILIDYHLPKINGIECLRKIKAHRDYKDIPVVMWSTSSTLNITCLASREGAQGFFQKPDSLHELVAMMQKILRQNRMV
jgi:DNA-binding NtrC family response regulator